jgi:hypothetical protein
MGEKKVRVALYFLEIECEAACVLDMLYFFFIAII